MNDFFSKQQQLVSRFLFRSIRALFPFAAVMVLAIGTYVHAEPFAEDAVQELETLINKNYTGRARQMALKRLDELISLEGTEKNRVKRLETYRRYLLQRLEQRAKGNDDEPEDGLPDSDGDGSPDTRDSQPLVADSGPVRWEFNSLSVTLTPAEGEPFTVRFSGNLQGFLQEGGKSDHPLSLMGVSSIDKLPDTDLMVNTGNMLSWTQPNRMELARLETFIKGMKGDPVSIVAAVDVMFFNSSARHAVTMSKGNLPVYAGTQRLFTAECVERDIEIIIPADTKYGMLIRFAALLKKETLVDSIEAMKRASPRISLEDSGIALTDMVSKQNLLETFRTINRNTVPLWLRTPSGDVSWRVARKLGDDELSIGDVLNALNQQSRAFNGRLIFVQNKGGVESILGIDNDFDNAWLVLSKDTVLDQNGLVNAGMPDELTFSLVRKSLIRNDFQEVQKLLLLGRPAKDYLEKDGQQHFYQWKAGADAGWPEAIYLLALCTSEGIMVPQDTQNSLMLHQLAASRGLGASMNRLGEIYQVGLGVDLSDDQAVQWFMKAAEKGDPVGQDNLARCYYYGLGVTQDMPEAVTLFLKAAGQNHMYAIYSVGNLYMRGVGVERDHKIAFDHFLKAAEMGCPPAMVQVGVAYRVGLGAEKDLNKAFTWFRKSVELGRKEALISLGEAYEKGWSGSVDLKKAFEHYLKAYEAEIFQAAPLLGRMYSQGKGCRRDVSKAIECFLKGAEGGDAESMAALAGFYLSGDGINADPKRGIELYEKAASIGYLDAWVKLGEAFEFGRGVDADPEKAVSYYSKAAKAGNFDAAAKLGWMYETGLGVKKNPKKALELYKDAAEKGSVLAQAYLAIAYQFGRGVEQDMAKAVTWLQKAADQGDAKSIYNLGECYEKGLGVERQPKKAVELYRTSATLGFAKAQVALGVIYHMGELLPHDPVETIKWWEKAANQNEINAILYLALMYERGAGVEKDKAKARYWFKRAADLGNTTGKEGLERLQ